MSQGVVDTPIRSAQGNGRLHPGINPPTIPCASGFLSDLHTLAGTHHETQQMLADQAVEDERSFFGLSSRPIMIRISFNRGISVIYHWGKNMSRKIIDICF
jgi:hypothetical protein